MQRQVPGSRCVVLAHAGPMVPLERPHELAAAMTTFHEEHVAS
jgi:pimeloyl-ACP methyl ester carboxylesterase